MSLEQDWKRVSKAYLTLKEEFWNPSLFIYADIENMRKADNKGIDFAIRRLKASDKYGMRIKLYGAPTGHFPRHPLKCHDPMLKMMRHYKFILVDTKQ